MVMQKRRAFTLAEVRLIKANIDLPGKEIVKLVGRQKSVTYRYIKILKDDKKQSGKAEPKEMMPKIRYVFQMLKVMHEKRLTLHELSKMFDLNERTTYRYIDSIKGLGVPVDKDYCGRYFIEGSCPFCNQQHTTKNDSAKTN
jgi:hypothetical protein